MHLRVAFIAGTLVQGGAEKQLVYMVRGLLQAGVSVRVYSLTRGEYYEPILQAMGVQPIWIGQFSSPVARIITLAIFLYDFKPHVVQSCHFFTNLYAGLAARIYNALGIGGIRSDFTNEMKSNPKWGKLLANGVDALIANSQVARHNSVIAGIPVNKVHYLPNVIDLAQFDCIDDAADNSIFQKEVERRIVIASVGRLVPVKRYDRFINAFAIALREMPSLLGILIGDGPEKRNLQVIALQNGLTDKDFMFLGQRDDIPAILKHVHIFVLTSDHEGFPNVLLEAMASKLPIITTPAGDSVYLVQEGRTGYVIPYENNDRLVDCIIKLAQSEQLRSILGQEGRMQVEYFYAMDALAKNLLSIYQTIASQCHSQRLIKALSIK